MPVRPNSGDMRINLRNGLMQAIPAKCTANYFLPHFIGYLKCIHTKKLIKKSSSFFWGACGFTYFIYGNREHKICELYIFSSHARTVLTQIAVIKMTEGNEMSNCIGVMSLTQLKMNLLHVRSDIGNGHESRPKWKQ